MTGVIPQGGASKYAGFVHKRVLHPTAPERICWGYDKYCPADDLACGNGTIRTPHPVELFGEDWLGGSGDGTPAGPDAQRAAAAASTSEETKP